MARFSYRNEEFYQVLDEFLEITRFNTDLLEPIIRHLVLIDRGSGWHNVTIEIKEHKVSRIIGADSQKIEKLIRD